MIFEILGNSRESNADLKPVPLSSLAEAGWVEKDLENILAQRTQDVLRDEHLMTISQERRGGEDADILALDHTGVLHIFEIKRTPSEESNLLQVIRYGQLFGQFIYDELNLLFKRHCGEKSAELDDSHSRYFDLPQKLDRSRFNQDQRFVVVTAGMDMKTLDSIDYWRRKNVPIRALTYHVYGLDGRYLLEFQAYSPSAQDYAAVISHDYLVNTNMSYSPTDFQDMLDQTKAAAYHGNKFSIDRIQKGDRVFLYHTGVGFIAVGRARGRVVECDYQGDAGAEHHVKLDMTVKVDPVRNAGQCVSAREVNERLGSIDRFRGTVRAISREAADLVEQLLKERNPRKRPVK